MPETVRDERVERQFSRAEDQDDQRCHQEGEGRGGGEFIGIREERQQRVMIAGPISDRHVGCKQESENARAETHREQDAAHKFEYSNERGIEGRRWDAESGEVIRHLSEIAEFAQPVSMNCQPQ